MGRKVILRELIDTAHHRMLTGTSTSNQEQAGYGAFMLIEPIGPARITEAARKQESYQHVVCTNVPAIMAATRCEPVPAPNYSDRSDMYHKT